MSETAHSAIAAVGIDIGKNSFHVVGLDSRGAVVLRQKWSRGQVESRFANMPPCLVGMEACVGAHHLSRQGTWPRCPADASQVRATLDASEVKENLKPRVAAIASLGRTRQNPDRFAHERRAGSSASVRRHRRDRTEPVYLFKPLQACIKSGLSPSQKSLNVMMWLRLAELGLGFFEHRRCNLRADNVQSAKLSECITDERRG